MSKQGKAKQHGVSKSKIPWGLNRMLDASRMRILPRESSNASRKKHHCNLFLEIEFSAFDLICKPSHCYCRAKYLPFRSFNFRIKSLFPILLYLETGEKNRTIKFDFNILIRYYKNNEIFFLFIATYTAHARSCYRVAQTRRNIMWSIVVELCTFILIEILLYIIGGVYWSPILKNVVFLQHACIGTIDLAFILLSYILLSYI